MNTIILDDDEVRLVRFCLKVASRALAKATGVTSDDAVATIASIDELDEELVKQVNGE